MVCQPSLRLRGINAALCERLRRQLRDVEPVLRHDLWKAPDLEVGTYDGDTATQALSAADINEIGTSGVYVATRTAPGTAGQYVLIWTEDGTLDPDKVTTEDLVVTGDTAAIGGTSNLYVTSDELKEILQLQGETFADSAIDIAVSSASRACDAYKKKRGTGFYPTSGVQIVDWSGHLPNLMASYTALRFEFPEARLKRGRDGKLTGADVGSAIASKVEGVGPQEGNAQNWEKWWWGDCVNTFGEEAKQIVYAHRMGLVNEPQAGKWPVYDLSGRSVIDLGGGPASMLLKCVNRPHALVVDPCPYPSWIRQRYAQAGIGYVQSEAEGYRDAFFRDEAWCYNVLQHVVDPEEVIATARAQAGMLRIFEWIETETNVGHPHTLHASELNDWIGAVGSVDFVNENGAVGLAYYGAFDLG